MKDIDIKSLIVITVLLAASFYNTDLSSGSTVRAVLLPIADFILLCSLAVWLVNRGFGARIDRSGGSGGFPGDFFDGGGDGGGCD